VEIYKVKNTLFGPGGTAINCAENIAMWNINTAVRGNSIGNDELGTFLIKHLDNLEIVHKDVIKDSTTTPTCSIYIDESGERTIISSGYEENNWSNLNNIQDYDSLLIDRYSIKYVKEELKKVKKDNNIFLTQAGYEEEINYELDFLVVSKNEIEVKEANEILEKGLAKWILLTSSNLPARLLSTDGVLEIVPPDFKTINATGAGDATAAYISAFGIKDIVDSVKKACAAGAIVAGTNDKPNLKMIDEISKLVEINPR
jgi:sugar/nucleoside kinase (ribokinase family)